MRAASTRERRRCRTSTRGWRGWESWRRQASEAIEAHVRGLVDRLLAGLDELGATVVTPRGDGELGPLVCVAATDAEALVAALGDARVVVSSRDESVRVSLHLYNVPEDVDRILEALSANRSLLA